MFQLTLTVENLHAESIMIETSNYTSFPPAFRSHGIGNSPTHPQKQAKDYCRLKHFKDILFESIHIILIIDYETMIL